MFHIFQNFFSIFYLALFLTHTTKWDEGDPLLMCIYVLLQSTRDTFPRVARTYLSYFLPPPLPALPALAILSCK